MTDIGFALIFDDDMTRFIVETENAMHDEMGFFDRLGAETNLPHLTLFQGSFTDDTPIRTLTETVAERLSLSDSGGIVELTDVTYKPDGWWFWLARRETWLIRLHEFTLGLSFEYLDPCALREHGEGKDAPPMPGRNPVVERAERRGSETYGYRYAADAHLPHVTIGRNGGWDYRTQKRLRKALGRKKAEVRAVTCYRMGSNGTHAETLCRKEIT